MSAIATQATQIQDSLLSLANTQDGNGQYIFGGFATQTQPFSVSATGATYAGDQGQRQVQIAAGQTVVVGDNGDLVFNQIKTGNGTFTAAAEAGNTGTGVIGATTVTDPAGYTGGNLLDQFHGPEYLSRGQCRQRGRRLGHLYARSNDRIRRRAGDPVRSAGRRRLLQRGAEHQSERFTTVQNLVTALQAGTTAASAKRS